MSNVEIYLQAIIGMLMITAPFDPIKVLLFNKLVEDGGHDRFPAAARVALTVLVILSISVLVGRELLQLLGIDLGAFGLVGGLIVAGMGFEMLYSGGASKAQGGDVAREQADEDAGLVMPLAMPLVAGPGAIATAITLASVEDSWTAIFAGLAGVVAVALATYLSMAYLGDAMSRVKPTMAQFLLRMGGMLLATIGCQLGLSGIRAFYGF